MSDTGLAATGMIVIDDVAKVQIRVGEIKTCEPVDGSSKLYKLHVDFGELGVRVVLAGLAKFYKPEVLIGTRSVFVTNMQPREMVGVQSHGMILIARDEKGNVDLISVGDNVENGARLS